MKFVLGLVIVIGCVLGGFVLHHGQLILLFVPTEYLIIAGMSIGALVAGNPGDVLKDVLRQVCGVFKGAPGRKQYVELLQMIYELMQLARKEGVLALEGHVNQPHESSIMSSTSPSRATASRSTSCATRSSSSSPACSRRTRSTS